jgi:glutamate dehydrogenase/leucine dehydrogenase
MSTKRDLEKYREIHKTLHEKFLTLLARVIEKGYVNIDPRVEKRLWVPETFIHGAVRVPMDNGKKEDYDCYRAQYHGENHQGGFRVNKSVCPGEIKGLSFGMEIKNNLMDLILTILGREIRIGGGKGGLCISPKEVSPRELQFACRGVMHVLAPYIGSKKDGLAPDEGSNGTIMHYFLDELSKITGYLDPAGFTGKLLEDGGCLGRDTATSMGAFYFMQYMLEELGITEKLPCFIHGCGNAAIHWGRKMSKLGYPILGFTDTSGWVANPYGVDVEDVIAYKQKYKTLAGYSHGKYTVFSDKYGKAGKIASEARILYPAAFEDTVDAWVADHSKHVIIVGEAANSPLTEKAQAIFASRGVYVGSDSVVSGGGVLVSLRAERQANIDGRPRTAEEVDELIQTQMRIAFNNIWKFYTERKTETLRDAGMAFAVQRIADRMMVEEDLDAPYGKVIERGIYDVELGKFVE